ncbi:integrase catalytic domain-containing protein [Trichonephila clavata]|uniref:Integrase catalytic domain-containing protein n=1 Tax=Trichonephila clavata TaxID=2740835 RepID=A0A8X6GEZ6_TRICU|nr:integrase catalytic domain-containing protein [Trichonephila clavata]
MDKVSENKNDSNATEDKLNRLKELESFPDDSKEITKSEEESYCEERLVRNYKRVKMGRVIVQLHIKENAETLLGYSKENAVKRTNVHPLKGQSPSEERGKPRDDATTSQVSLSAEEKKINNAGGSDLLQTFSALVNAKSKGNVQLRCMLDGGSNKSFILREVVELLDLKVVDKEALAIYTLHFRK